MRFKPMVMLWAEALAGSSRRKLSIAGRENTNGWPVGAWPQSGRRQPHSKTFGRWSRSRPRLRLGVRLSSAAFHLASGFGFLLAAFSHSAIRFLISARMVPLVCSAVICELLMTLAPSAIMSGAAARWLSRWLGRFAARSEGKHPYERHDQRYGLDRLHDFSIRHFPVGLRG